MAHVCLESFLIRSQLIEQFMRVLESINSITSEKYTFFKFSTRENILAQYRTVNYYLYFKKSFSKNVKSDSVFDKNISLEMIVLEI